MMSVDNLKLYFAGALVIAGVAGYYLLGENAAGYLRVSSVVAGLLAGAVVAYLSTPGKDFIVFARESVDETKKVVWPTRKETLQVTGVIFLFSVILAIFLWIVDSGLSWVMYDIVLGRGK